MSAVEDAPEGTGRMRTSDSDPVTRTGPGRIVGVDVARALALLGMIAAHTLERVDPDAPGGIDPISQLVAGRPSALFAVLAGVSLALVTRDAPSAADAGRRTAYRWQILTRALLLAVLGLLLGLAGSGVAVIITYYGLLFVLALPVLTWGWRSLALLAVGWGLLSPVVSTALRPLLPDSTRAVPSLLSLADPLQLLSELAVTGYYPVLTWGTYLFAGMALGRLDLRRPRLARALVVGGALLAVTALGVSRLVTGSAMARRALLQSSQEETWQALDASLRSGMFGTFPLGSWWWLLVWSPHTGSIIDLAHTTGTALLVLGLCLLLTGGGPPPRHPRLADRLRRGHDDPHPLYAARPGARRLRRPAAAAQHGAQRARGPVARCPRGGRPRSRAAGDAGEPSGPGRRETDGFGLAPGSRRRQRRLNGYLSGQRRKFVGGQAARC